VGDREENGTGGATIYEAQKGEKKRVTARLHLKVGWLLLIDLVVKGSVIWRGRGSWGVGLQEVRDPYLMGMGKFRRI